MHMRQAIIQAAARQPTAEQTDIPVYTAMRIPSVTVMLNMPFSRMLLWPEIISDKELKLLSGWRSFSF